MMENIDKNLVDELDKLDKTKKEIEDKISNVKNPRTKVRGVLGFLSTKKFLSGILGHRKS